MPTPENTLERFEDCVIRSAQTGSRYICNPPVMDTDNDIVILVNGYYDYDAFLVANGWERCNNEEYEDPQVRAFRKGDLNYICIEDEDYFNRYCYATEGARALNLTNKEDRVKLFEAILWAVNGAPWLVGGDYLRGAPVDPIGRAIAAVEPDDIVELPMGNFVVVDEFVDFGENNR